LLYKIISTKLKPNSLYEKGHGTDANILLSDLLSLLKNGLGFTNINILDYSCNECVSPISHLRRSVEDTIISNPHIDEFRKIRTSVRKRPGGIKEWNTIKDPTFFKVTDVVGKAKSDSRGLKNKTVNVNRHSFNGGKRRTRRRRR